MVGPSLEVNDAKAKEIVDVMSNVPGVKDLGVFKSLGQPDVKITVNRVACERYGLNTGDVDNVIQAALGGTALTQVYEGEQHYDLTVRWAERYRESLEAIRQLTVPTPDGNYIPLGAARRDQDRRGPHGHLPAERVPLHAGEVLGPRPRPGQHHRGGAARRSPPRSSCRTTRTSCGRG